MSFTLNALVLGALVQQCASGAVELTGENFEALLKERGVGPKRYAFISFYAPWCKHCEALKPAWDQLGDAHAENKAVLIAAVDCTLEDGKGLCEQQGIKGYPTIKYYKATSAHPYGDEKDFESLDNFVKGVLKPPCEPDTLDFCSDTEKGYIGQFSRKTQVEGEAEYQRLKFGTPFVRTPTYTECEIFDIELSQECHPAFYIGSSAVVTPQQGYECCWKLGEQCGGFLFVSQEAQQAREQSEVLGPASIYFCNANTFYTNVEAGKEDPGLAVGYVKPDTMDEEALASWPLVQERAWTLQRIYILKSIFAIGKAEEAAEAAAAAVAAASAGHSMDAPIISVSTHQQAPQADGIPERHDEL